MVNNSKREEILEAGGAEAWNTARNETQIKIDNVEASLDSAKKRFEEALGQKWEANPHLTPWIADLMKPPSTTGAGA